MATPFPFGSGNVLTAAQMNAITTLVTSTKTASHTLTIADVSTRVIMNSASATTITVNTSIFGASDVVEILNIGAGVCTVTAGSCTVGTSGTLALVQNAGGTLTFISASASVFRANGVTATPGGLVLIKSETITPGVSTHTVTGAFSATYEQYVISVTNVQTSANDAWLAIQLGSTTTAYYGAAAAANYATGNFTGAINFSNASNFNYAFAISNPASNLNGGSIIITNPFATKRTTLNGFVARLNTSGYAGAVGGFQDSDTSFTAFTLIPASGTFTLGNVSVYGLAR